MCGATVCRLSVPSFSILQFTETDTVVLISGSKIFYCASKFTCFLLVSQNTIGSGHDIQIGIHSQLGEVIAVACSDFYILWNGFQSGGDIVRPTCAHIVSFVTSA